MNDGAREILSGSVAGGVGKLFEYPFDTVKVRLQVQSLSNPQYKGAFHCFIAMVKEEGLVGMYKGISAPIVAAAAENAVLFGSFDTFNTHLTPIVANTNSRALVCGSLSGLAASFVLTPIELVKCQVQVDVQSRKANILDILRHTYRHYGISGFWRGQMGTALREAGGSAAWFGTYHLLKDDVGSLLAGAAAGVAYNLSLFPADSIKSRMQTDRLNSVHTKRSFLQTGREIVHQSGIRGLYRGSLVTCLRAGPSNAVIFGVHDYIEKRFR